MRNNNQHRSRFNPEAGCHFCLDKNIVIDYKDIATLRVFISSYGKIASRRRSGVCSAHHRELAGAIKRARVMALMPFIVK